MIILLLNMKLLFCNIVVYILNEITIIYWNLYQYKIQVDSPFPSETEHQLESNVKYPGAIGLIDKCKMQIMTFEYTGL